MARGVYVNVSYLIHGTVSLRFKIRQVVKLSQRTIQLCYKSDQDVAFTVAAEDNLWRTLLDIATNV